MGRSTGQPGRSCWRNAVPGRLPDGRARLTAGYRLPAHIIHTVRPGLGGRRVTSRHLAACYPQQPAVGPVSQGSVRWLSGHFLWVYGYPLDPACEVALRVLTATLAQRPPLDRIVLVAFSGAVATALQRAVDRWLARSAQTQRNPSAAE